MIVNKKTNYSCTISLSDDEMKAIADGQITGFNVDTPYADITLLVSEINKPTRIPLKDEETGAFKCWSPYWVAKFSHPAGVFTKNGITTRVMSKEEINNLNKGK